MTRKYRRNTDGTFKKGNAGRPKGARNKATMAAQILLDGQAKAITSKAIEMALEGDTAALKMCLDRVVPPRKDRPVDLPSCNVNTSSDVVELAAALLGQVTSGNLSPLEARPIMEIIEQFRRVKELDEIERRLAELEKKHDQKT